MRLPLFKATSGLTVKWFGCLALAYFATLLAAFPMDPTNRMDYNHDGMADIGVFREASRATNTYDSSTWYFLLSPSDTFSATSWGVKLDIPVPADYDGDHQTDLAIFRWFDPFSNPGESNQSWLLKSVAGVEVRSFGHAAGRRCSRDFTGDGKADIAELRRENISENPNSPNYFYVFYFQPTLEGLTSKVTGGGVDSQVPVPEDYNANIGGLVKSEIAVFDTKTSCYSVWPEINSTSPNVVCLPITGGSTPAPGDYDGDGRADYAAVKASPTGGTLTWTIQYTSTPNPGSPIVFGLAGDRPVPADYDGDGKTDLAVVRPNATNNLVWEIRKSSTCPACQIKSVIFGLADDTPLTVPYFSDAWY